MSINVVGEMLSHDTVMDITTKQTDYFSRLFAFIRHPISSVRLSVAKTLHILATDPRLSPRTKWMQESFPCFLYQSLLLEERSDTRQLCLSALEAVFRDKKQEVRLDMLEDHLEQWYTLAMTPLGMPMDENLMYRQQRSGHNVDKPSHRWRPVTRACGVCAGAAVGRRQGVDLVQETRVGKGEPLGVEQAHPPGHAVH